MKLAVFYHCWLPEDGAVGVLEEQAAALVDSGLESAAELHVGVNGDPLGSCIVQELLPRARIEVDPDNSRGEAFTIGLLQRWLPSHESWAVCYHHMKAATHPPGDAYSRWRRCLEREVILRWRRCVLDLESGFETVGAHWHRNLDQQYWAGNFWWATAKYLSQLPPIDPKTVNGRSYEAEVWIGKCGRNPRFVDYARHPLMSGCR